MEVFDEFAFSNSFFEVEEKHMEEYESYEQGASVQSDGSEVDPAELEAALYSQIHFEPNEEENAAASDSLGLIQLFDGSDKQAMLIADDRENSNIKDAKKLKKKRKEAKSKRKGPPVIESHVIDSNIKDGQRVKAKTILNNLEVRADVQKRNKEGHNLKVKKSKDRPIDQSKLVKTIDKSADKEIVNRPKVVIEIDCDSDSKYKSGKKRTLPGLEHFLCPNTQNLTIQVKHDHKKTKHKSENVKETETRSIENVKERSSVVSTLGNPFKAIGDRLSVKKTVTAGSGSTLTPTLKDQHSGLHMKTICSIKSPKGEETVIVIDSDLEDVEAKTVKNHPKITIENKKCARNMRKSTAGSSSESENSEEVVLESDDSDCDEDIHINVSGLKGSHKSIELNCEKLPDWDAMNITVRDIQQTQPDQGWNLNDLDKYGPQGNPSRYYTKSKVVCNNCNERGHISKVCPQPQKTPVCFLCGLEGHRHFRCPDKSLCFNCERPRHNREECRFARRRQSDMCLRCSMRGHLVTECPDLWRRYHITMKSSIVNKGAKISRKNPANNINTRKFCYNCAAAGHFGHECDELMMDEYKYAQWPYVVSYQEPPNLSTNITTNLTTNRNWEKLRSADSSFSSGKRKRDYSPQPGTSKKIKNDHRPQKAEYKNKTKKEKKRKGNRSPSKMEAHHSGDFLRGVIEFYDNEAQSFPGQKKLLKKQERKEKRKLKREKKVSNQLDRKVSPGQPKDMESKRTMKKQHFWNKQKEKKNNQDGSWSHHQNEAIKASRTSNRNQPKKEKERKKFSSRGFRKY